MKLERDLLKKENPSSRSASALRGGWPALADGDMSRSPPVAPHPAPSICGQSASWAVLAALAATFGQPLSDQMGQRLPGVARHARPVTQHNAFLGVSGRR